MVRCTHDEEMMSGGNYWAKEGIRRRLKPESRKDLHLPNGCSNKGPKFGKKSFLCKLIRNTEASG